jgi:hypothetical protein
MSCSLKTHTKRKENYVMLSSPSLSSLSVIADIRNAIFYSKQKSEQIQVEIAGIQLTVDPDSILSEVVCLWETEFEKREK